MEQSPVPALPVHRFDGQEARTFGLPVQQDIGLQSDRYPVMPYRHWLTPRAILMTKNLIQLLYLSKSAPDIVDSDLDDILATATKRNRALGITGVLCHKGGYFMQLLEGEEIPVLELYLKIIRDPRHSDPVIIKISTATEPIFSGWAMGSIDENLVPHEYGAEILKLRNSASDPGKALEMMRSLRLLLG